jgi:hypothetical protein
VQVVVEEIHAPHVIMVSQVLLLLHSVLHVTHPVGTVTMEAFTIVSHAQVVITSPQTNVLHVTQAVLPVLPLPHARAAKMVHTIQDQHVLLATQTV